MQYTKAWRCMLTRHKGLSLHLGRVEKYCDGNRQSWQGKFKKKYADSQIYINDALLC